MRIFADVSVDMPLTLDIGYLRGYGKKPDEDLLPEENDLPASVVRSKKWLHTGGSHAKLHPHCFAIHS